jgi:hypothetical protein
MVFKSPQCNSGDICHPIGGKDLAGFEKLSANSKAKLLALNS